MFLLQNNGRVCFGPVELGTLKDDATYKNSFGDDLLLLGPGAKNATLESVTDTTGSGYLMLTASVVGCRFSQVPLSKLVHMISSPILSVLLL